MRSEARADAAAAGIVDQAVAGDVVRAMAVGIMPEGGVPWLGQRA